MTIEQYLLMAVACGAGAVLSIGGLVMFYTLGYSIGKRKSERKDEKNG
jgi:ABC-type cobalt transport system substrate-binding protein